MTCDEPAVGLLVHGARLEGGTGSPVDAGARSSMPSGASATF